jgi:hypothetical protein
MSNIIEDYDRDVEWLYSATERIGIRPTEAEEHKFCDRVMELTSDGYIEAEARTKAFHEIFG